MRRFLFVGLTGLFVTHAFANIEWQNTFSHSVPEPASMYHGTRDAQNNNYFIGASGNGAATLWKFNTSATLLYRTLLPNVGHQSSEIFTGTHGDLFYGDSSVSRIDQSTGAALWTVSTPDLNVTYVDENGDVYLTARFEYKTEKRSFETGALLWSAPVKVIPTRGANFLATTSSGVVLASKANGQTIDPVSLTPAPVGEVHGVPMPDGKVFLLDSQNRGYAYRPGAATLNLGLVAPYQNRYDFRSTPEGYVLIRTGLELACFDTSFHKIWTASNYETIDDIDGAFALIYGRVTHIATGQLVETQAGRGDYFAGSSLFISLNGLRPQLIRRDRATNATLAGWKAIGNVQGAGRVVTATAGPGGDLLAVTEVDRDFYLTRISGVGQHRWTIRMGLATSNTTAGISLSKDKRTAYVWVRGGSAKTYEVDVTRALVTADYLGQAIAKGDFIYRTNSNNFEPVRTSKFNAATGQEVWRIKRVGFLSVGDDGSVYVGATKNRGLDGQLQWTAPGPVSYLAPLGDRVAALEGRKVTFLNTQTGQAIWNKTLNATEDFDQRSDFELRRINGRIAIRWNNAFASSYELNELTGGTIYTGNWGFWDANNNLYRVNPGTGVVRCATFADAVGTPVDPLTTNATSYVSDGAGGYYLVGIENVGTPGSLFVAKWRP